MPRSTVAKSKTRDSRPLPMVRFNAKLMSPAEPGAETGKRPSWSFLRLPESASARLASRGMVSVKGTLNGSAFQATLEPDGEGGHWLKVDRTLRAAAGIKPGDEVTLAVTPFAPEDEPEPALPPEWRKALAAAPAKAREVWADITPVARRDWIFWMTSAKQAETRARRITTACDMLAKGKRRACCFDRSGMYGKSLSCPIAADDPDSDAR